MLRCRPTNLRASAPSRTVLHDTADGRHRLCLMMEHRRPANLHAEVVDLYEKLIQEGEGVDPTPMSLSPNAFEVVSKRYLLKDVQSGTPIETPNDMCSRVANKLAATAINHLSDKDITVRTALEIALSMYERYKRYYEAIRSISVIPAGRTLANEAHSVPNWYAFLLIFFSIL
jgi:ribonucleotide reductase alpha subunit